MSEDGDRESRDNAITRCLRWLRAALAEPDQHRAVRRWLNAIVRGAAVGFCLRGGLHVVSLALSLLSKSGRQRRQQSIRDKVLETGRYTAFLGALAGVYVGLDEGIGAAGGKARTAAWRAFAAGALCGPTLLLTGAGSHNSLSIYVLLRGIVLLVRCGNKQNSSPAVRTLLAPTRWQHGDTALMCLATSQLGYSWILMPQTLPPAYNNFLNYHGGKQMYHYNAARELTARNAAGLPPQRLHALRGTPHEKFCDTRPCGFLHAGHGCNTNVFHFLPRAYARALPVYLPVYLLPAILVHRKRLLDAKAGPEILGKVATGAVRSSLFLALYCAFAWRGACTGFHLTNSITPVVIPTFCWTGGLATLVEKKSRRMELALYCVSRALESFALCLVEWGVVGRAAVPRRLDVLMFSLALGCILHCYSDAHGQHRDVFRSKYLNVLDFVFGSTGMERGCIYHHPSTRDLLAPHTGAVIKHVSSLARSLERMSEDYEDAGGEDVPRWFDSGVSNFRTRESIDSGR